MPPPTKKRKTEPTVVEEVTFDLAARQEYLTGFHKRKLQRAKQSQELAEKKARAEKIEERKRLREERKADLERHVQEVNALLRPTTASDISDSSDHGSEDAEEWTGVEELPEIDHEAEYVDEDKYTTVTVEAMDVSKDGLYKAAHDDRKGDDKPVDTSKEASDPVIAPGKEKWRKRPWTKEKPKDQTDKAKKKRKRFRYENKAERKFTRMKEKSKNSKEAKARRAG